MAQRYSIPTLPKLNSATSVSTLDPESSPKNDCSSDWVQRLPNYLDPSKVVSVEIRGDYFGSWDTPREQWVAGFMLMAIESNCNEKQVKNFLPSQLSISAIKQECNAIAQALGATLIDTTGQFNAED
ncbi:hypothetical protein L1D24_05235 [Vibrio brasiliensis]|uniref:hypothetical protein n=1 Tax=Vibrio brasiliensis TaxID=170652 RepID=UPI001EFEA6C5|nr:hypothetical protein [Vibrio brasiliensis]MCG9647973.1 hypothetical protein [Vibrio brasiliensis]